jgi:diketogulonate reductase-like aldo/keto reductase
MKLTIGTRFKLNNGVEMPCLGLGTWKMTEVQGSDHCPVGIELG